MKLEHFRLILTEDPQLPLQPPSHKSRDEVITELFTTDFDFNTSRGKEFKYMYKATEGSWLIGLIFERQNLSLLEDPSSTELQQRPNWEPNLVIINNGAKKGKNSQLFLLESAPNYYNERRINLLNNHLADRLNQRLKNSNSRFLAEFAPVLTMTKFEELYGQDGIKTLTIEYTMPNFLGIGDELNRKLGEIKAYANATKVKEIIENNNGNLVLDPKYEDLKAAVESSRQGQSRITVKDFSRTTIYDSVDNETVHSTTISIGEIDFQTQSPAQMEAILKDVLKQLNLDP